MDGSLARWVVVGTSASGKSTMARRLAARLALRRIEMDAIHWGPSWTPRDRDQIRAEVAEAVAGERWVLDGNYSMVRDLVWPRAQLIVWLDYPLPVVMGRLLYRTLRRIVLRERLWGTNLERWGNFFSRDSLFLWVLRTHWARRTSYPPLFVAPAHRHLRVVHLRSPATAEAWLAALPDYSAISSGSRM